MIDDDAVYEDEIEGQGRGSLMRLSRLRNTPTASKQDRQMAQKIVLLHDRGLLSVTGLESPKFLQDLITADIDGLAMNQAAYAGLLTPQGKILFDFFVIREERGYLLDCFLEQREQLIKRLMFYKLRAKLDIAPEKRQVAAVLEGAADGAIPDPRADGMGARVYALNGEANGAIDDYHRQRISQGLAEGGHDYGSGELFPHEANFDQIGALSFRKGCFVGQEVVSRIEHRGTARSRILPCRTESKLPAKGSEVKAGSTTVGTVCSGMGDRLLAHLRLDRLEEAHRGNVPVMADGSKLFPMKASWARYDVPAFD
jgi:folate-binding protein YgfZ